VLQTGGIVKQMCTQVRATIHEGKFVERRSLLEEISQIGVRRRGKDGVVSRSAKLKSELSAIHPKKEGGGGGGGLCGTNVNVQGKKFKRPPINPCQGKKGPTIEREQGKEKIQMTFQP